MRKLNKQLKYVVAAVVVVACVSWVNPIADPIKESLAIIIEEDIDFLLSFYEQLHQNPEISLEEEKTSANLAKELLANGFEVTENFGGYGIVGILKNGEGPLILYRTDMDALPMYEKTELPYASEVEIDYNGLKTGTMHSCGHDMHMTTWIGTAMAMAKMKDQWSGTLMMIGQPAEEIGMGAKMMLEAGLYDKFGVPDFGIGLHCSPTIKAGQIGLREGYTMATTESVDIYVKGVGAHGASPHMSIDPVVLASMMVMDLQTIVSRNLKPTESAVITVGAIHGGTKHNIIPDEVRLQLTIRTFKEDVRKMVHERIAEVARGVAIAAGLPEDMMPDVVISDGSTPANYNDPELVEQVIRSAASAIGSENVIDAEPEMVGEDFSRYGNTDEDVPTVLYWLGTVTEEQISEGDLPGLHSPYYHPSAAKTIQTGVAATSQTLVDLFNGPDR